MKKKHIALISSVSIGVTLLLTLGVTHGLMKNGLFANADTNPYVLNMTRSISASELSNGQAVYNTNNGNPITFKFDSSKAEVNNGGILNLLTDGYFYNDTAITGIEKVDVTLSSGNATLTYGNDKNNLNVGSEALNTNGQEALFNVNFTSPSNYFKIDVGTGPSLLKNLKVTYSCVNSGEKTPMTILFQGDSITDNSRSRTNLDDLGGGYAAMVADALNATYGDVYDFTFINRAHSGWNLVEDWNAGGVNHYEEEFYQYNPDITTILIGYNDIMDYHGGVTDSEFESCYRELLEGLTDRNIKAICMAPFYINESSSNFSAAEFAAKSQIVSDLASEFNATFLDMKPYMLQAVQDGAYKMELFGDLTHPWAAGCRIIADLVVDKISKLIDSNYQTPSNLGEYVALVPTSDNDDDFTNQRVFLSSANGRLAYDSEVFYNGGDLASSKSVKMTNELLNPEQSNAYTRALFDFHLDGKRDLSAGTLKVNIKVNNCVPTVSFRAFSALTSSAASNVSTSYSVTLNNSSKALEVGNGWYQVSVDLASWAASQTNTALANAIALEIALSKGESDSARATYGVNGSEPSYMWMDNLVFDLTPTGEHRGVEFTQGYAVNIAPIPLTRTIKIDFQFTTADDTYVNFMLGDGWSNFYGYYRVNANGSLGGNYNGVSISPLVDGYFRVTVVLNELTNVNGDPQKIDLFYIRGSGWSNAEGYVDFNPSYNPGVIRGQTFSSGVDYTLDISTPFALTDTFNIDFKFTSEDGTYINFMLGDGWSNFYGYYRVNANGSLGGTYSGVSIVPLEDGYYRVTVNISQLDKVNGNAEAITKINLFYIRGNWSDAAGYVDFDTNADVGVIRGQTFSSGANYILDLSTPLALTETIYIDFKFSSATDTHINFMLGDGWSNFFGYFRVNANGSLGGNYDGVSITYLPDGYLRVTVVLSELTIVPDGVSAENITKINLFYIRGNWSNGAGYVDFNPSI